MDDYTDAFGRNCQDLCNKQIWQMYRSCTLPKYTFKCLYCGVDEGMIHEENCIRLMAHKIEKRILEKMACKGKGKGKGKGKPKGK